MEARLRDLERQMDKMQVLAEDVSKHDYEIYGNGKAGLKTEVELLKDGINRLVDASKSRATREWTIVGGLALLVIERFFSNIL